MNKRELIKRISDSIGVDQRTVQSVMNTMLMHMEKAISSGETLSFERFGRFEAVERAPRMARNPRQNTPVEVPARTVAVFRPSPILNAAVAEKLDR